MMGRCQNTLTNWGESTRQSVKKTSLEGNATRRENNKEKKIKRTSETTRETSFAKENLGSRRSGKGSSRDGKSHLQGEGVKTRHTPRQCSSRSKELIFESKSVL